MKKYTFNNIEYELIENKRDAFSNEEVIEKCTEYFMTYDYIVGDWSYGKLRLKGFCEKGNENYNRINDYSNKEEYLKNNCAFQCRYFILKKLSN